MKLISHRGNINGRIESYENEPNYIDNTIKEGYDVEIDVRIIDNVLYLGHDIPLYGVDFRWFRDRISKLWIHCKTIETIDYISKSGYNFNYFFHDKDDMTITSKGYFWTYPNKPLTTNSIAILPEVTNYNIEELKHVYGICSDNISNYNEKNGWVFHNL